MPTRKKFTRCQLVQLDNVEICVGKNFPPTFSTHQQINTINTFPPLHCLTSPTYQLIIILAPLILNLQGDVANAEFVFQ